MASLASLSRQCRGRFGVLTTYLKHSRPEHLEVMPPETIEAQEGKFRVWCGNVGALQTGYSSLDYRLRESTVMQSTVSKHLEQLSDALLQSCEVTSGARPSFENEPKPADMSEESSDDEEGTNSSTAPRKELDMRLSSIIDCLNSLYHLSYKIRNPTLRPTTKAILYKEVDPETNIDVFYKLHELDKMHIHELLLLLRQEREPPEGFDDFLAPRLAASITLRRRCFKYWEKHAKKLSREDDIGNVILELPGLDLANMQLGPTPENADAGPATKLNLPPGASAPATLLSKTDATPYDASRDDRTERETVISFASTALDTDGKGIDLPGPPSEAKKGEAFTCPYCHVLCPEKQGRGRAWRQHVLHDLQPYVCTYQGCPLPNELYRTRSQWVKHEDSVHRQCWRCFEHPDHVYTSELGLRSHLVTEHAGTMREDQIENMMDIYSSTLVDDREYCPICLLRKPFERGIANHLANHLERAALFALPRNQPGADGSADESVYSNGTRGGAGSSRDTGGTLSSFAGTVADKSAGSDEKRSHNSTHVSSPTSKDPENLSQGSQFSSGFPRMASNDTGDEDQRPVEPKHMSPGAAAGTSDVRDTKELNEEACEERTRKLLARFSKYFEEGKTESDIEVPAINKEKLHLVLRLDDMTWPSFSPGLINFLIERFGRRRGGVFHRSEAKSSVFFLVRWVDRFISVFGDPRRALSLAEFKDGISRLIHTRETGFFGEEVMNLVFKAYATPGKEVFEMEGFIRYGILVSDWGTHHARIVPPSMASLKVVEFEDFASMMLGALGPHIAPL